MVPTILATPDWVIVHDLFPGIIAQGRNKTKLREADISQKLLF